jgi:ATP adenylyltransferase
MIERLWSAWRASYVTSLGADRASDRAAGPADNVERTVFTRILESGLPDDETHIVHRGETCFVIANLFPYSSGHMLVVPYRAVPDLDDLTDDETADLWATVTDTVRTLRAVYSPQGMNVGLNLGSPAGGSIPDHLHAHVVPRWTGDSNFMTAIGGTQTLPESLSATAARVRAAWDQP